MPGQTSDGLDEPLSLAERELRRNGLGALTRPRTPGRFATKVRLVTIFVSLVVLDVTLKSTTSVIVGELAWAGLIALGFWLLVQEGLDDSLRTPHDFWGARTYREAFLLLVALGVGATLVALLLNGSVSLRDTLVFLLGILMVVAFLFLASQAARVGLGGLLTSSMRAILGTVRATFAAAGRALPVTFAVLFVALLSGDFWRVCDRLPSGRYVALIGLMLGVCLLVAIVAATRGLARELASTEDDTPQTQLRAQVAAGCEQRGLSRMPLSALRRDERANVWVVFLAVVLTRLLTLWALSSAAFFMVGWITVDDGVFAELVGAGTAVSSSRMWVLLRVSLLLSAVAALTFGAGALTSEEARQNLVGDQSARLTDRLRLWQDYAALLDFRRTREAHRLEEKFPYMSRSDRKDAFREFAQTYGNRGRHDRLSARVGAEPRRGSSRLASGAAAAARFGPLGGLAIGLLVLASMGFLTRKDNLALA